MHSDVYRHTNTLRMDGNPTDPMVVYPLYEIHPPPSKSSLDPSTLSSRGKGGEGKGCQTTNHLR